MNRRLALGLKGLRFSSSCSGFGEYKSGCGVLVGEGMLDPRARFVLEHSVKGLRLNSPLCSGFWRIQDWTCSGEGMLDLQARFMFEHSPVQS